MNKKKEENAGAGGEILEERDSEVGVSKQNRNVFILIAVVAVFGAAYYVFSKNGTGEKEGAPDVANQSKTVDLEEQRKRSIPVVKDHDRIESLPPQIPEMPEIVSPPVPSALPPPSKLPGASQPILPQIPQIQEASSPSSLPSAPAPGTASPRRSGAQDRNSQMLVVSGGGVLQNGDPSSDQGFDISNPLNLFNRRTVNQIKDTLSDKEVVSESATLSRTGFPQIQTTYVGLLDHIIAQGKMIDAVVESSINTDLQGMLRAIVQKDTYSEAGNNILIPRGSRLIGSYNSNITFGQTRVSIIWDRLMLPNGIDIAVSAPATDPLGKTGISGNIDNKFVSVFTNALLVSAVNVGGGLISEKLTGANNQSIRRTVDSNTGNVTTEGSSGAIILSDATKQTADSLTQYLNKHKESKPTITINQGEKIKVFVNKDIVFSKEALGIHQ